MVVPKRAKAEKMNGWHAGRSITVSQSEPVLTFRTKHPTGAAPHALVDKAARKTAPLRGDLSSPRPLLHSPKPKGGGAASNAHASDASRATTYAHAATDARGGRREQQRNDRQSAVFLSPQRSTVKRSGEQYDCVAPGYYDSSVLSAPWTMTGRIQRPEKLSPTFLAPGRLLPPVETSAGTPLGEGWDEGGQAPPAQHKPATAGEQHKLARKQREIQKLQARLQNEASRRAKGRHHDDFRSPAAVQRHEASFEQRLATATTVPNTDRAIAQLVARGGESGFLDEVGFDSNAGLTTTGPHVHGSLSLSSGAFANGVRNAEPLPRQVPS